MWVALTRPQGLTCFCSWAIPIPILNTSVLESVSRTDDRIPLPIVDVNGRAPLGHARYGDVWRREYGRIRFSNNECVSCEECQVAENCPTAAFTPNKGIDRKNACGAALAYHLVRMAP